MRSIHEVVLIHDSKASYADYLDSSANLLGYQPGYMEINRSNLQPTLVKTTNLTSLIAKLICFGLKFTEPHLYF
jgi:hypothetical protein